MNRIRAISLHQPWASAMALGLKNWETRNRLTHVNGDVVICSSRKPIINDPLSKKFGLENVPLGFALAVVELFGFANVEMVQTTPLEKEWGNYSPGRYVWFTRNLRRLKNPVPVKGKQGFFFIIGKPLEEILRQL